MAYPHHFAYRRPGFREATSGLRLLPQAAPGWVERTGADAAGVDRQDWLHWCRRHGRTTTAIYGALAPNAPLRAAVTALAPVPVIAPEPKSDAVEADEPRPRAVSHYLWAMLLARIYEAFPLTCPLCNAPMRIIAFINDSDSVRQILNHIGEPTVPPKIAPARGPPLWESLKTKKNKRTPTLF